MKKEGKEYIFKDAFAIADYVRYLYARTHDYREISPIKLQKSLYFLFAFWGGMIEKSRSNADFVEYNCGAYSPYLFKDQFEAWVYGPVLPEIYKKFKDRTEEVPKKYDEKLFGDDIFLKETIDSILNDVFNVADFKLVSISHEDMCWKNHFDIKDIIHEDIIPREEIIDEYSKRESII